ncbi:hypothetical protein, conserved [Eimeria maxima]|uniref:Retrotransposon gag domain-containing protein n=1 Tax=Eimeria maxima TaxID=5804 RepID=U6MCU8_EIMMA|nr:hypothetical protein, conserved [Eimeria maxima]CDJ59495.1 hypothetical protein, conserved [Eimeria maxima]
MNQALKDPEIADLHRKNAAQMDLGSGHTPHRAIVYEDGRNMRNFLDLAEIDLAERGVETRQWGDELKRYLTGEALGYWLYLRRTGASLTDWDNVRQQFCARFCSMTKERMKEMIADNVWQGDHKEYTARFAAIVAQGITMAPDLLVGYYLVNLPEDLYREITRNGMRKFVDWQEAATALATTAALWRDSCEERLRLQRELEDIKWDMWEGSARSAMEWYEGLGKCAPDVGDGITTLETVVRRLDLERSSAGYPDSSKRGPTLTNRDI